MHSAHNVDVVLRVADDGGFARRAAGGMDADDLRHRTGKHAERIIVPKIGFVGERKLSDVFNPLDVLRADALAVQRRFVECAVLVYAFDEGDEPLALKRFEFCAVHGFD
jgi:hypothetical protein